MAKRKHRQRKRLTIFLLIMVIIGGAWFIYPRYRLKSKGYNQTEIAMIMNLDQQASVFMDMEKIDDLEKWLNASTQYPRYPYYQAYRQKHDDLTYEEVIQTVDAILDHDDLFIMTSNASQMAFLARVLPEEVFAYIEETTAEDILPADFPIDMLLTGERHFSMSYEPADLEVAAIPNSASETTTQYLRREANEALKKMAAAAEKEGYILINNSSYRSYIDQEEIYKYYLALYGQEYCDQYVGDPGYSEHQSGLAIDLSSASCEDGTYLVFGDSPDYAWVVEHCAEYGFILRYPSDKVEITQVNNEPWHFRYVGKKTAMLMEDNHWCLEEYWQNR